MPAKKKLTYWEQLQHPMWQRKRLEVMEAAGFECQNCGDKDKQLHVHHKQYFKGRMAWEYSEAELQVLCDSCHAEAHWIDERLRRLIASSDCTMQVYSLIAGYSIPNDIIDDDDIEEAYKQGSYYTFLAGVVARLCEFLVEPMDILKVAELAASLTRKDSEARPILEKHRYRFEALS